MTTVEFKASLEQRGFRFQAEGAKLFVEPRAELTPVECEALQGFPQNWTAFGYDGKPISDSAQYRMLGNAVCVPTAEWIANRIMLRETA